MSNNNLIIGLGGTGGKIIRALRKAIYEEFRNKEPISRTRNIQGLIEEKPHPVKLGYLYVDSDESLMRSDEPSWRIPGDTLQIGQASQLQIQGANLLNVLENLGAYPNVAPWIGDRAVWNDILGAVVGAQLGGQKRRLGRFLFACKATGAGGFVSKLRNQVQELTKQTGEKAVTFHVCCGLAGGTGSGSFVDVVTQIRNVFAEDIYRVILYALLPNAQPPNGWDSGNYHANGYGALVELNSLCVGAFHPHDVADGKGRVTFRDASGTPVSPINGCYVFTNENERGKVLGLEDKRDELSPMVASFLFQKIITVNETEWSKDLRFMENAENGDGLPETAPGIKTPERSKRFMTFGIKRLVIPDEEIREYLSYQLGRQAILQLQFNNWSNTTHGFTDSPVNEAFAQYVADSRSHERWFMTDSHICLEAGILPMEIQEHWKPIEAEWNTMVTAAVQIAIKGEEITWMGTLTRLCEDFLNAKWRGKGVKEFYRIKANDIPAQASAVVRAAEHELFEDWAAGRRSMFDLGKIVSELRGVLVNKADVCKRKVSEFRGLIENSSNGQSQLLADIRVNNQTWADIGVLGGLFGKRKQVIQAQAEVFKRFYSARHRVEAWAYAGKLTDRVIEELDNLAGTIQANIALLTEVVNGEANLNVKERFIGIKERLEARCKDETANLSDQVIKLYNAKAVRDFATRLNGNEDIQRTQTAAVRSAMLAKLGDTPSIAKFHQNMTKGVIMDLIETVCTEQAEKAHSQILAEDSRAHRVLGNNIVDKLYRDYSGNPMQLSAFVSELVASAGLYLEFDPLEENSISPGAGPNSRVKNFAVIIPKGQENPTYKTDLENAFTHANPSGIKFVEGQKGNEIIMVGISNLFPLRYAKQTRLLRQKYEQRVSAFERAKFEVHTEGDGTQHPPIFLLSSGEIELLPFLLLGRSVGLIQELEDPETGRKAVYLVTKDERGRDNDPILLGETDEAVLDKREVAIALQLKAGIVNLLQGPFQHREKRQEIIKSLDAVMQDVQTRIPNPLDKRRRAYKEAVTKAEELLK